MTDIDVKVTARYEYDAWGLVTGMYNQSGEHVREGNGWVGDLGNEPRLAPRYFRHSG